ncbi:hypothetical protein O3M35_008860 [Rhynocoris fuscipes]|uniref:Uncharacterized protein n=1 Tax=Rhynocoris fuscipes TaxID=488301 RepID=A0AAW1DAF9_9HEMI
MVKFEHVLRQNLVGNSYLSFSHLKTRFTNGWYLQEAQLKGYHHTNKESVAESRRGSNSFSNNVINWYPLRAQDMVFISNGIASNSLWFDNDLKQFKIKNKYNLQQISTLKTYTYHTIKSKSIKKKTNTPASTVFEKLRKMFRETVKIKVNKTIMKKKKPCHLRSSELIDEAMFDGLIKEKSDPTKDLLTIDPVLSNHLLKQAEKKQSPDPNVSLNSAAYPYIPCPLKKPENYVVAKSSSCTYQQTSLAPLFTVNNLIISNKKIPEIDNKPKSIKPNFWCQYSSDKNFEIKEINQAISNKIEIKQQITNEKSKSTVNLIKNITFEPNRYLNEFKQIQNEPRQNLNAPNLSQNESKQNLNEIKLSQNESKLTKEIKPVELLLKSLETAEKNKLIEPKNPLQSSKKPVFVGKYYTVPNEVQNELQKNLNETKLFQNESKQNLNELKLSQNESKQNLNEVKLSQNESKQNLNEVKLSQNESKLTKEIKPVELLLKSLETAEKNKFAEPKNPLQSTKKPVFVGKYYTVPTSEDIKKFEPDKNIQILVPPKKLLKKTVSINDFRNKKHLNLNFPYKMTCPNQIKRLNKAASEVDLIKRTIMKEADKFSKDSVNIRTYNSEKFCKQLKKYYTNGNTVNVTNKADKRELKQLIEKISQQKTTDKTVKLQIPLTSPNIFKKKEQR